MSESRTVFLFGYQGRRPAELLDAVFHLDAVLWDIRFSPRSRNPQWSKKSLAGLLGHRYLWVAEFGNEAYRTSGIRLHNPDRGLLLFDAEPRPVVLMCVCKNASQCHRSAVGALLQERLGVTVQEIDSLREIDSRQETERQTTLFGEEPE